MRGTLLRELKPEEYPNEFGVQGWELVNMQQFKSAEKGIYFFKRPKEDSFSESVAYCSEIARGLKIKSSHDHRLAVTGELAVANESVQITGEVEVKGAVQVTGVSEWEEEEEVSSPVRVVLDKGNPPLAVVVKNEGESNESGKSSA